MSETEMEGVLDRIRKLLRLAGNNSNAHEAALAAARANELMLRYKLEGVSVDVDGSRPPEEPVWGYYENDPILTAKNLVSWKGRLASTLAYHNACRIVHMTEYAEYRRVLAVRIIGAKSNAQVVGYLFDYISREIERICKDEMARGVGHGKSWANDFKHGAVLGVGERLKEMKAKVSAEYSSTALLVLDRERAAMLARYEELTSKFKKSNAGNGGARSMGALEAGRAAGRNISVNRGIEGGKGRKSLES